MPILSYQTLPTDRVGSTWRVGSCGLTTRPASVPWSALGGLRRARLVSARQFALCPLSTDPVWFHHRLGDGYVPMRFIAATLSISAACRWRFYRRSARHRAWPPFGYVVAATGYAPGRADRESPDAVCRLTLVAPGLAAAKLAPQSIAQPVCLPLEPELHQTEA